MSAKLPLFAALFIFLSGREESNLRYKTPSLAYYHYTTPRYYIIILYNKMISYYCFKINKKLFIRIYQNKICPH